MKNTSLKLKFLFIFLITIVFLSSCGGTRQTNTQTKDSVSINNSYSQGEKIVLGNTFTYTPFDVLKPMVIEGKVYNNAIVSNDKSITKEKWKKVYVYITKTVTLNRTTERKDNTLLWIGIAAVVCLFVFLWFYLPKLNMRP